MELLYEFPLNKKGSHHKTMRDDVIDYEFYFFLSFIACFIHGETL